MSFVVGTNVVNGRTDVTEDVPVTPPVSNLDIDDGQIRLKAIAFGDGERLIYDQVSSGVLVAPGDSDHTPLHRTFVCGSIRGTELEDFETYVDSVFGKVVKIQFEQDTFYGYILNYDSTVLRDDVTYTLVDFDGTNSEKDCTLHSLSIEFMGLFRFV